MYPNCHIGFRVGEALAVEWSRNLKFIALHNYPGVHNFAAVEVIS